jgi:hypothetical protein
LHQPPDGLAFLGHDSFECEGAALRKSVHPSRNDSGAKNQGVGRRHAADVFSGIAGPARQVEVCRRFPARNVNGQRDFGHGGVPGINSQLDIYSGQGYDVAVMSNYDPPAAQRVAGKLRSLICRK